MDIKRCKIETWSYADYSFKEAQNQFHDQPVLLLLHGFNERAKRMLRSLQGHLPDDVDILAPNAPFPLPFKVREASPPYYRVGHAWYFFDDLKEQFYIDYQYPADWLLSLLTHLKLHHRPIIVIGYSQGGYLAPFIAEKLENCLGVISLNARFREDLMRPTAPPYPLYSINGEDDDKVDPHKAEQSFKLLQKRGYKGNHIMIPDCDHDIGPALLEKMREGLNKLLHP